MFWEGEVCFHDGLAWTTELIESVGADGKKRWDAKPICLGQESDILGVLRGQVPIPEGMHPRRKAVLRGILERGQHERTDTVKPNSSRQLRAVKAGYQRVRPAKGAKHRTELFGRAAIQA